MTRAKERLIVSGSVDLGEGERDADADRVGARPARSRRGPRAGGRHAGRARARRRAAARAPRPLPPRSRRRPRAEPRSRGRRTARALRRARRGRPRPCRRRRALPQLVALAGTAAPPRPPPLVHGALALRAVRVQVLGALRARDAASRPSSRAADGRACPASRSVAAVHELLEQIDLAAPVVPEIEDELVRGFVTAYCRLAISRAASPACRESRRSGTSPSSTTTSSSTASSTCCHLADGRALVVDYKTNALGEASPEEIVEQDYRLQRLVYALACFRAGRRGGRGRLPLPRAAGRAGRGRVHARRRARARGGAVGRDRAHPGRRVPADAERVRLRRLPGARPRLRRPRLRAERAGCVRCLVASCRRPRKRVGPKKRAHPADHRAARRRARRRRRSRSASAARSSCSSR